MTCTIFYSPFFFRVFLGRTNFSNTGYREKSFQRAEFEPRASRSRVMSLPPPRPKHVLWQNLVWNDAVYTQGAPV